MLGVCAPTNVCCEVMGMGEGVGGMEGHSS